LNEPSQIPTSLGVALDREEQPERISIGFLKSRLGFGILGFLVEGKQLAAPRIDWIALIDSEKTVSKSKG
jgi:hypothetical protein